VIITGEWSSLLNMMCMPSDHKDTSSQDGAAVPIRAPEFMTHNDHVLLIVLDTLVRCLRNELGIEEERDLILVRER
jgi:hypothetical protein